MRCARRCGRRSGRTRAAPRRSRAAAPIPAWGASGCSRRRCSRLAEDTGRPTGLPADRAAWARLMQALGVRGVHIAERDTQAGRDAKPVGSFCEHLVGRGVRGGELPAGRARLGHARRWFPPNGHRHATGCKAAICIDPPGADRGPHLVPAAGPQFGFLVTHNEAISIADYYTVGDRRRPSTGRPATTPTTPATTRSCRCTRPSARAGCRSASNPDEYEITGASTNWACCSTAMRGTRSGTARASPSTRRAPSPLPERHLPAGRSRSSPAWSGRWRTRAPASSRPTRWTTPAAWRSSAPTSARSRRTTPTGPRSPTAGATVHRGHRRDRPLAVQERAGELEGANGTLAPRVHAREIEPARAGHV